MRDKFFNLPGHGRIVHELQALNSSFVPILNYLICYKSEIGLALQRMVESYNILLLLQLEGFYTDENAQKKEYSEKNAELNVKLKEIADLRKQLLNESSMMHELIESTNRMSQEQADRITDLE